MEGGRKGGRQKEKANITSSARRDAQGAQKQQRNSISN